MRRVWLLGEGVEDIGRVPDLHRRPCCDFEGDLPRMLRRLVVEAGGPERFGYRAQTIRSIVERIPRAGRPTRSGGKSKDLRDAVIATLRSVQGEEPPLALVAVIDSTLAELPDLRTDARLILEQARGEAPDVPVAIGLAVHEIEIWMLADPASRAHAFPTSPNLPTDLESVTDPKSLWATCAGMNPVPSGRTVEEYADAQRTAAWNAMRPPVVIAACPQGFGVFHTTVQAVLERLRQQR
jgi:hypothetical protein